MAKADRLLLLLEALQSQPSRTGPELARRLGVDARTVRRDVVALHALGIPVEAERGRGGGYRLGRGFRVPPLMFTDAEAETVALALTAARHQGLDDIRRSVVIRLQDEAGQDKAAWELTKAWPCKYDPTDLNGKGNEVAIDTLELCNEGIKRIQ